MTEISLQEMLEAGVHFGHKKDKWNPKMRPFIFAERNGVHIFDLVKTKEALEEALKFLKSKASTGGTILFVGTKNQVKEIVKAGAESCEMPYMVERWPGGMLTNFNTVLSRLKYIKDAEKITQGQSKLTKKETLTIQRELDKLNKLFEGVKDIKRIPDVMFVTDLIKEKNAVKEAKRLGIPVIGIADSNANPDIEFPIPANDDAVRSVAYIVGKVSETIAAFKKAGEELAAEGAEQIVEK
jgi:small subunit ribosomal protein S2